MTATCPPEILLQVFHELVRSAPPTKRGLRQNITWLSTTYVCREWRNLILNDPRLWNHLVFSEIWNFDMLQTFLDRSKNLPLSVIFQPPVRFTARKLRETVAFLARPEVTQRLAVLHIPQLDTEMAQWLEMFSSPAPVMRSLSIEFDEQWGPSLPPYPNFFGMTMPLLQEIRLDGIAAPWMHSAYKDLTRLELLRQDAPSLSDVLEALRSSPNLERLSLCFTSVMMDRTLADDREVIKLERLKQITLGSHPESRRTNGLEFFDIISHISFPDTATLSLQFVDPQLRLKDWMSTCTPLIQRALATEAVRMELGPGQWGSWLRICPKDDDEVFSLLWEWGHNAAEVNPLGSPLDYAGVSAVPFPATRWLLIDCTCFQQVSESEWTHTLKNVPNITHLRLHAHWTAHPLHNLFNALARLSEAARGQEGGKTFLCPHLDRVSIYVLPEVKTVDEQWGNEIVAALAIRAASGHRLSKLDIMVPMGFATEFSPTLRDSLTAVVDELKIADIDYDGPVDY